MANNEHFYTVASFVGRDFPLQQSHPLGKSFLCLARKGKLFHAWHSEVHYCIIYGKVFPVRKSASGEVRYALEVKSNVN